MTTPTTKDLAPEQTSAAAYTPFPPSNLTFDLQESSDPRPWTVTNHIWIYSSAFILAFGICGNVLTILVMGRTRMRHTSTSVYLRVLAAADLAVVVIGLLPEWLYQLHVLELWEVHPWVCKVELYLYYTALDLAIWTLVAFSCDRFVAVCFPLKKKQFCTTRRAKITCGLVFLLANLNLHVFWTRGYAYNPSSGQYGNCNYLPGFVTFELEVRPPIVFVAAFLLPCVLIIIWNSMIVARIGSTKRLRKQTITTCSVKTSGALRRMDKGLTQTTAMCISTSMAFVILVLPNIVLFIGKKSWHYSGNQPYWIAKAVAGQLVYIHHSINFVLYSLTGSRFRRELASLCRCSRGQFLGRRRTVSLNSSSLVVRSGSSRIGHKSHSHGKLWRNTSLINGRRTHGRTPSDPETHEDKS